MDMKLSGIVCFLSFVDCTVLELLLSLLCSEDLTRFGLSASLFKGALKNALHLQDCLLSATRDEDFDAIHVALDNGAHPSGWSSCWEDGSAFTTVVAEIFRASLEYPSAFDHAGQFHRIAILGLLVDYGLHSFGSPPVKSLSYFATSHPHFGRCDCHSIVSLLAHLLRLHSDSISSQRGTLSLGFPLSIWQQRHPLCEILITLRHLLAFLVGAAMTRGDALRRNLSPSLQEDYFDAMMFHHGFPDEFADRDYLWDLRILLSWSRELLGQ